MVIGLLFTSMILFLSLYADEANIDNNNDGTMEDEDFAEPLLEPPHEDGHKSGNVMSFSPPNISEEEQFSVRMPSNLLCDACKAAAFQVWFHIGFFAAIKPGAEGSNLTTFVALDLQH